MDVSMGIRRRAGIGLLSAILCWSPDASHALAGPDLNPGSDATPPTVAVASPLTGAVVAGMIAVMARAFDDNAVVGVQFLLNGSKLGAEDTAPPYAITWDTETGSDGAYILSAQARDVSGRTAHSAPVSVTVANLPRGEVRIEEWDAATVFSDSWLVGNTYPWSGGSARQNAEAGAYAIFTFTGTGVSWIGYRGRYGGIVRIYLDGALTAELDTYAPAEEIAVPVYTIDGLADEPHSLMIELTGLKTPAALGSETAIDAFDVHE